MSEKDLTLSIETAVQGGSISLLRGTIELAHCIGSKDVSRSEDVLQEIRNIFDRNDLRKEELKRIVVSRGPGSHTGVRIGMAIGIGLRKALDCELIGSFVLEAMLLAGKEQSVDYEEEIVTAVPIGRSQVCRQIFKLQNQKIIDSVTEPQLSTVKEFSDFANSDKFQYKRKIVMHRKLYLDYRANFENTLTENSIIIDAGENIARLNGLIETKRVIETGASTPIYIREHGFSRLS
jgi:tRNA threonylcarbamoyladenosine biosynthesis protein TsaB